ncbi:pyrroline-5-carboxylate reductase [Thiococcus pfennigii]|jgi:pyrroline-5-carboxylate reductase|uniref:pyrroline-5-carboxylate reductase n=1 Tax=Thiococcus pfennigii TaxID=1057 RepID=UPI00190621EC|nr:pyrroline-5-carboxylate reductase [Thiococcus pfennigii]MBK1701924.1 pyrroline-5-carboxylate reductase [Thiococcus pfennigii]MBK1730412.1 pyrroline-5-carboxylate reductase [Thiococcus pfennigii]
MKHAQIAFIGGGNMATSLIAGLVADGYQPQRLIVSDPDPAKARALTERFGVRAAASNAAAVAEADTLVLCVKPQIAPTVCRELAGRLGSRLSLVISVMAGVREATIADWLGTALPIVRAMPNTPAMLQAGAVGLHASPRASAAQRNQAETILRAVGMVRWVAEEDLIDAVTAISGSGPAYFFLLMETLEAAAVDLGLPAEDARLLTIQTALGAARMAIEGGDAPATLRARVTSPGGTTEAALAVFAAGDLEDLVARATAAARRRAAELSDQLTEQS